jgi:hypothetical protein
VKNDSFLAEVSLDLGQGIGHRSSTVRLEIHDRRPWPASGSASCQPRVTNCQPAERGIVSECNTSRTCTSILLLHQLIHNLSTLPPTPPPYAALTSAACSGSVTNPIDSTSTPDATSL